MDPACSVASRLRQPERQRQDAMMRLQFLKPICKDYSWLYF
jgi:hypothetical protein